MRLQRKTSGNMPALQHVGHREFRKDETSDRGSTNDARAFCLLMLRTLRVQLQMRRGGVATCAIMPCVIGAPRFNTEDLLTSEITTHRGMRSLFSATGKPSGDLSTRLPLLPLSRRATITISRKKRETLMCLASTRVCPPVCVLCTRSDPARSTCTFKGWYVWHRALLVLLLDSGVGLRFPMHAEFSNTFPPRYSPKHCMERLGLRQGSSSTHAANVENLGCMRICKSLKEHAPSPTSRDTGRV